MAGSFFGLGILFLLLFLHPFVTYPVSLAIVRLCRGRMDIAHRQTTGDESIAVCFCAFNEEPVIEAKMQNLLGLRQFLPDLDILAYVDAATDRTAELLLPYADRIALHISPERHGKTHGMNLLAGMSDASIIVFTDANVILDAAALTNLLRYFADPRVGCVCAHVVYMNSESSDTTATRSLYWRLEEWIKQLESDTGSVIGAHGAMFAMRRSLRHPVPHDVIDDLHVSLSILCDGYRVVRAPDVKAYERAQTSPEDEFARKKRIGCQAFNVHRLLWPRLRKLDLLSLYKYTSHKLLRWFSIYTLCLAMSCFVLGLFATHMAITAGIMGCVASMLLYAGYCWRFRFLSYPWAVFGALLATGIGVWLSLRGERFQVWTPRSGSQA